MNGYEDTQCEKYFTPPDEGRLLTPNDMKDAMGIPIKNSLSFEADQIDFERLRDAQDAKTAPIVRAEYEVEYQVRIEALIEEIVSDLAGIALHSNSRKYIEGVSRLLRKYEALKAKYTSKGDEG